jgi:hypothetical protein
MIEDTSLPVIERIAAGITLDRIDGEYLHASDLRAEDLPVASWIPFLLYPTEGTPFVDLELFESTRERYDFTDLYQRKQGFQQPWVCFMQSLSDLRLGDPVRAAASLQTGLDLVFGTGLLCETGPGPETVGLPPYFSAHGSYVVAYLERFVSSSIWDGEVALFAGLSGADSSRTLAVTGARCAGGITVDASYAAGRIDATLQGPRRTLVVAIPVSLLGPAIQVTIDGEPHPFAVSGARFRIDVEVTDDRPVRLSVTTSRADMSSAHRA